MSEQIKDCPFCGSTNIEVKIQEKLGQKLHYACECKDCGGVGPRTLVKKGPNFNGTIGLLIKSDKYSIEHPVSDVENECWNNWYTRKPTVYIKLLGKPDGLASCPFCGVDTFEKLAKLTPVRKGSKDPNERTMSFSCTKCNAIGPGVDFTHQIPTTDSYWETVEEAGKRWKGVR